MVMSFGRLLIIIPCILMVGSILSGCTTANDINESVLDRAASATVKEWEPREISLYYPGAPQRDVSLVEEEMNKTLKERINATIKINAVDWAVWTQKINLMSSSNEPYDLVFTASWDNLSGNVAKGAFVDLLPLMNQYGQDIMSGMNPLFITGNTIDGKLFALPTQKEFASQQGMYLNKELVDKHQIDITSINTLADLEPILQKIKDNEPDVVPFWANRNWVNSLPYEKLGNDEVPGALVKNGDSKVVNPFEQANMKDFFKLMFSWNQKGFFQKDPATNTDAANHLKEGTVFATWTSLKPGADGEKNVGLAHKVVQVVLEKTPYTTTNDLNISMLAISRTSQDPERAMMLLNLLHSDAKLLNLLVNGVEGKHYVKVKDKSNIIKLPAGAKAGETGYAPANGWMMGNQFLNYLWEHEDENKWKIIKEFNQAAVPTKALGFVYDSTNTRNEEAAIARIYDEYMDGLSTGVYEPNQKLKEFNHKLRKAGLSKVIAEMQKQLDDFLNTNRPS
ncbi:ABC transporter substrate-binding protein [Paenibacillus sp. GCM10023252]|uniref:ABC transporter substrate-binding protein n=1 Tax=Paenibacillus sp. GCM10023252 TaxID=3252649 RepID=UPI00361871C5